MNDQKAQVMLEFIFSMIVLLFIMYGLIEVFQWSGEDLANGRRAHTAVLINHQLRSVEQIDPNFYTPSPLKAIVGE